MTCDSLIHGPRKVSLTLPMGDSESQTASDTEPVGKIETSLPFYLSRLFWLIINYWDSTSVTLTADTVTPT